MACSKIFTVFTRARFSTAPTISFSARGWMITGMRARRSAFMSRLRRQLLTNSPRFYFVIFPYRWLLWAIGHSFMISMCTLNCLEEGLSLQDHGGVHSGFFDFSLSSGDVWQQRSIQTDENLSPSVHFIFGTPELLQFRLQLLNTHQLETLDIVYEAWNIRMTLFWYLEYVLVGRIDDHSLWAFYSKLHRADVVI